MLPELRPPARAPEPSSSSLNPVLERAERLCLGHKKGTIAYRQCRGDVWQGLRRQCINERGRDIYDGNYCDAERRFIISE